MNAELDKSLKAYLEQHEADIIDDINELVAFESVEAAPVEDGPFGQANKDALAAALNQCRAAGLTTRNFAGYAGDATWGEGEGAVAVLSHLDIVPLGDGWKYNPLAATLDGRTLYGRGVSDDKGPGVAALWAVKALKNAGFTPKRPIRLIYGCCEETGGADLEYYNSHASIPAMAFTPDAVFPVIHAEKARVHCKAAASFGGRTCIKSLKSGTRVNVVPNLAYATVDNTDLELPQAEHITLKTEGKLTYITAEGLAAHASTPHVGLNAIGLLMNYLTGVLPKNDSAADSVRVLARYLGTTYDGAAIGIDCKDEVSGPMTLNVGLLSGDSKGLAIEIDIRHPVTLDPAVTAEKLGTFFTDKGFTVPVLSSGAGLFYPKDHPLVSTLTNVYCEVTGDVREPIAIGGGTYAKGMPCPTVAFGMDMPDAVETAHMVDEHVNMDSLLLSARIFAHALAELSSLED